MHEVSANEATNMISSLPDWVIIAGQYYLAFSIIYGICWMFRSKSTVVGNGLEILIVGAFWPWALYRLCRGRPVGKANGKERLNRAAALFRVGINASK